MDSVPIIEPIQSADDSDKNQPVDETWSVWDIATKRVPKTWEAVFKASEKEFKFIDEKLKQQEAKFGPYFPRKVDLFRAFELTPLDRVRVVHLGMDPYINIAIDGLPQATGLSFSVRKGVTIPPSLKNIYKELAQSVDGFRIPNHGDLTAWARQGVLMLNACLTVRPGESGSHMELWLGFIRRVVKAILDKNPNCVFLLLGKEAQKIRGLMNNRGKVVETSHPSGFSAYRGFIGSGCYVKINEILKGTGQAPIDWNIE